MTTDSVSKQVVVEGAGWSIGGMAKGAGMLAPQLATMLVVLTTDAWSRAADLDAALRAATRVTFDRLDSDGCMSTNDTVTVMASGASGITPTPADFTDALTQACTDLAMQLLKDAEGADHEIAITALNAASEDEAVEVGRSVARSNLFKAAVFGNDPNWGRVLASIGTTRRRVRPRRPRRRDERRLGLPAVHAGRGPGERRPHRPRGQRDHRPQGRRRPRHRLDQRPHPRLRPREQRLQLMSDRSPQPAPEPARPRQGRARWPRRCRG